MSLRHRVLSFVRLATAERGGAWSSEVVARCCYNYAHPRSQASNKMRELAADGLVERVRREGHRVLWRACSVVPRSICRGCHCRPPLPGRRSCGRCFDKARREYRNLKLWREKYRSLKRRYDALLARAKRGVG